MCRKRDKGVPSRRGRKTTDQPSSREMGRNNFKKKSLGRPFMRGGQESRGARSETDEIRARPAMGKSRKRKSLSLKRGKSRMAQR